MGKQENRTQPELTVDAKLTSSSLRARSIPNTVLVRVGKPGDRASRRYIAGPPRFCKAHPRLLDTGDFSPKRPRRVSLSKSPDDHARWLHRRRVRRLAACQISAPHYRAPHHHANERGGGAPPLDREEPRIEGYQRLHSDPPGTRTGAMVQDTR